MRHAGASRVTGLLFIHDNIRRREMRIAQVAPLTEAVPPNFMAEPSGWYTG